MGVFCQRKLKERGLCGAGSERNRSRVNGLVRHYRQVRFVSILGDIGALRSTLVNQLGGSADSPLTVPLLLECIDAVGGEVSIKKYGVYRSVMACYARFRVAGCILINSTPQDFAI